MLLLNDDIAMPKVRLRVPKSLPTDAGCCHECQGGGILEAAEAAFEVSRLDRREAEHAPLLPILLLIGALIVKKTRL